MKIRDRQDEAIGAELAEIQARLINVRIILGKAPDRVRAEWRNLDDGVARLRTEIGFSRHRAK